MLLEQPPRRALRAHSLQLSSHALEMMRQNRVPGFSDFIQTHALIHTHNVRAHSTTARIHSSSEPPSYSCQRCPYVKHSAVTAGAGGGGGGGRPHRLAGFHGRLVAEESDGDSDEEKEPVDMHQEQDDQQAVRRNRAGEPAAGTVRAPRTVRDTSLTACEARGICRVFGGPVHPTVHAPSQIRAASDFEMNALSASTRLPVGSWKLIKFSMQNSFVLLHKYTHGTVATAFGY